MLGKIKKYLTLPRKVVMLGTVSFFNDVSSEMIYPLIPLFLVQVLGASPLTLGFVEGTAEATSSILKTFSGYFSDRMGKRKPLILAGYGISSFLRPLIGLASSWPFVLLIRFFDRVGKGLRTSPRDALIADTTPSEKYGTAYSLHRAMDHGGAVVGPLLAFLLLKSHLFGLRELFFLALIPGVIAFLVLAFAVKEKREKKKRERANTAPFGKGLGKPFYRYLAILLIFTAGNGSDAFILLHIGDATHSIASVPLMWGLFHMVKSLVSLPAGVVADRLGKKHIIAVGWVIFSLSYIGFGLARGSTLFIPLLILYAFYYGFTEGTEKALVAEYVPSGVRGTAFGFFHFVIGLGALPASLLFGILWKRYGAPAAFFTSSAIVVSATALLLFALPPTRSEEPMKEST